LPFAAASGVTITRYRHKSDFQEDKEVFIALGSNLGDRKETLERALKLLQASGVRIQDVSGLYESEPMYVEQQPQFLNAVCKVVPCNCHPTNERLELL
jgi:2-amino-4-hydroxy-6-hydroxymethyldihydropteridine diphosphokinase